jgi:hypothetical protein
VSAEERYRRGDKTVILDTLCTCSLTEQPIPQWVWDAVIEAWLFNQYDIVSWDEVFGPPNGKQRAKKRRFELGHPVLYRVEELRAAGKKIEAAFAEAGKDFGISGATAKSIYYEFSPRQRKQARAHLANRPGEKIWEVDENGRKRLLPVLIVSGF